MALKTKNDKKPLLVWFGTDQIDRLNQVAREQGLSVSWLIRRCVDDSIKSVGNGLRRA